MANIFEKALDVTGKLFGGPDEAMGTKDWFDLATTIYGVVDASKRSKQARDLAKQISETAGVAPLEGLRLANLYMSEYGRPTYGEPEFRGFGAEDIEGVREAAFGRGEQQLREQFEREREKIYQDAEARGMPSGMIAQQEEMLAGQFAEALGNLRYQADLGAAGLLQSEHARGQAFDLALGERGYAEQLLPFQLAQSLSGQYQTGAIQSGQVGLGGYGTSADLWQSGGDILSSMYGPTGAKNVPAGGGGGLDWQGLLSNPFVQAIGTTMFGPMWTGLTSLATKKPPAGGGYPGLVSDYSIERDGGEGLRGPEPGDIDISGAEDEALKGAGY